MSEEVPLKQSDMDNRQKKAFADRANAYLALAALDSQALHSAIEWATVEVKGAHGQTVTIMVPARPNDMSSLLEGYQHKIRQLEIGLSCVFDMLAQTALPTMIKREKAEEQLVSTTRDPDLAEDAQPFLKASGFALERSAITYENFWALCAQAAEKAAGFMRRALLSQGKGSVLRS